MKIEESARHTRNHPTAPAATRSGAFQRALEMRHKVFARGSSLSAGSPFTGL